MAKLDMHARLKKHAFDHALVATYSFSTAFFEDYALEMFKAFQDNGNISVVLDDAIYQEILEKAVETKGAFPRGANLRYLLHLDGYYRVLQSLLEVTALEYLDAIAEADPINAIREGFDPALPDLEDLIRQAFAMRELIVELEGSRLIVDTGKGRVSGPGFFKSTVASSNWIPYRGHLESLKERIKSRLAA